MTPKIEVGGDKLTVFRFSPEKGAQVPLISVSLNPSGVLSLYPSFTGGLRVGAWPPKGPTSIWVEKKDMAGWPDNRTALERPQDPASSVHSLGGQPLAAGVSLSQSR